MNYTTVMWADLNVYHSAISVTICAVSLVV